MLPCLGPLAVRMVVWLSPDLCILSKTKTFVGCRQKHAWSPMYMSKYFKVMNWENKLLNTFYSLTLIKNLHNDLERTISNAKFLNSLEFCTGMGVVQEQGFLFPLICSCSSSCSWLSLGNFLCKPVGTPACEPTSVHMPWEQPYWGYLSGPEIPHWWWDQPWEDGPREQ